MRCPKIADITVIAAALLLSGTGDAKAVFCHYLVLGVNPDHALKDVQTARSTGCDAFALDLLQPTKSYTTNTVETLFTAAQQQNFKLFFSIDISAHPNIDDFDAITAQYITNPAYYTSGPNNYPLISTFGDGGLGPDGWASFIAKYNGGNVYFLPDFDNVTNYYEDPGSFFAAYGTVVDGVFDWESAWPTPDLTTHENVSTSQDTTVQSAATAAGKSFMIGLSSLQFKDMASLDSRYFRIGDINLPQRMEEILVMDPSPDYVEVITWNDAGESHYVGAVWDESGLQPYSQGPDWDHSGWQPLLSSFITAWKGGATEASAMVPASGNAVGAMWYSIDRTTSSCSPKPDGSAYLVDAVNYAVVLGSGASGYKVRITSGGTVLGTYDAGPGLSYLAVPGIQPGSQMMELLDGGRSVVMSAKGQLDVNDDASNTARCNFNFQVAGLQ